MQVVIYVSVYLQVLFCRLTEVWSASDTRISPIISSRSYDLTHGNVFWPKGVVHYKWAQYFDHDHKTRFGIVFEEMRELCVKFTEVDVGDTVTKDYIKFAYRPKNAACFADTGRLGGEQYVTIGGRECLKLRSIRHLLMHAIGFWHEHQRPDNHCYVIYHHGLEPNIYNRKVNNYLSTIYPYDLKSITHFGTTYFEGFKNVSDEEFNTYPRLKVELSDLDKYKVKYLYCNEPAGNPMNPNYNRDKFCNDHQEFCDRDRRLKDACNYVSPV